jgi:hypothetical protein
MARPQIPYERKKSQERYNATAAAKRCAWSSGRTCAHSPKKRFAAPLHNKEEVIGDYIYR